MRSSTCVEQAPRVLGIAIGQELHRALEVREQDGHVLALALQRVLGRADTLGEMRRRVRNRRREAGRGVGRGAHGRGALRAELGGDRQLALALGAWRGQRGGALGAELSARRRLVLAAGALHGP